jgi:hypothetical protein
MTLAARLSTSANLGLFDSNESLSLTVIYEEFSSAIYSDKNELSRWNLLVGNFAIAQTQAISIVIRLLIR